jgi:transposase
MTCWRRLRDWQLASIWDLIHFALLDWLARGGFIDWSRAIVDSCSLRAVYGGPETGPNPTDRAKRGSKHHLICDARGMPLAVKLTGANRNDSQEALPLVDAIPPLQGPRGRRQCRPDCVVGDRGCDVSAIRCGLRTRRIVPRLDAPHRTRERLGSLAVGGGTHVRVAESVPASPRPLRQTGRNPRGIPFARLCADLFDRLCGSDG